MQLSDLGSLTGWKSKTTTNAPIAANNDKENNIYIVVLYTIGVGENFKNILNKYGILVYFNGANAIRNLLLALKDKDTIRQKSGCHVQV